MNLITTHLKADFDGLAGIVGLSRLVEGTPVLLDNPGCSVRQYMAIYKDSLPVRMLDEVKETGSWQKLYLVDVSHHDRLGSYWEELSSLPLQVIDHHPQSWPGLPPENKIVEEVGAATTIVVERLQALEVEFTPVEATLFLLGIYEDTGRLSYPSTTVRDVRAVAYLLDNGARIEAVEEFLEEGLSTRDREVFEFLLDRMEERTVKGIDLGIAACSWPEDFYGLNRITGELIDITGKEAFFTIVDFGKKQVIVGRSQTEDVPINRIMARLGGGGSIWAGSARFKGRDLTSLQEELVHILEEEAGASYLARQVMSTPVRTISQDTTIREAEKLMDKWGHSGLVVTGEDGEVVGVFSRRDLAKVKKHGLLHAPVKGYMSRRVISCKPDAPLNTVQKLMVSNDIGRIPVIDDRGQLVGIITRSDIIRIFYGQEESTPQSPYGGSLPAVEPRISSRPELLARLPEDVRGNLQIIGKLAEKLGERVYLVGGSVRDIFLGRESPDLDLAVEGDLDLLVDNLKEELDTDVDMYKSFGTAKLELAGRGFDFATTRRENYPAPGALPRVQPATLKEDLYRRDFTINALALGLHPVDWGKLFDYFGGEADIKRGLIRVLHTFSFADDPLRAIRALRFSLELGFRLEEHTRHLISHLGSQGIWQYVSRPRLREELEKAFLSAPLWRTARRLIEWNIWPGIFPCIRPEEKGINYLMRMEEHLRDLYPEIQQVPPFSPAAGTGRTAVINWKLFFLAFSEFFSEECGINNQFFAGWGLPGIIVRELRLAVEKSDSLIQRLQGDISNYELYRLLNPLSLEMILLLLTRAEEEKLEEAVNNIHTYIKKLRDVQLEIDGNDLQELGISPGPEISNILEQVLKARLEGRVSSRDSQLKYVRQLINEKGGTH